MISVSYFRSLISGLDSNDRLETPTPAGLLSKIANVEHSQEELIQKPSAKLADTTPPPIANSKFSQINSLYGGTRSEPYKILDSYFTLSDNMDLKDVDILERKITSTDIEVSLGCRLMSPSYVPHDSEKCLDGMVVSESCFKDLSRADYMIELPGFERNLIKLDNNMPDEEKIAHLHGIFGEHNTKIISEIAHQGHMAEPAGIGLAICKEGYILSQGNAAPLFIISKQEDGSCRITSSLIFGLKNIMTEKIVDGISLEMKRTSVLHTAPDNKANLQSGAGEEKDGMRFKINYVYKGGE